jgi:hypothetical protein
VGYRSPNEAFNLVSDEWDGTREREGWREGALVGQRIGGELIGATMSEVEPGNKLWPYHTHHLNEEWVIVLRGEPTLRTPEGEHVLQPKLRSGERSSECASDQKCSSSRLRADDIQEALDHGVHLVGHLELVEVASADGHPKVRIGL